MNEMIIRKNVLVKYSGENTTVNIPESVREIGKNAFKGTNIEIVEFSSAGSLLIIGESAFSDCRELKYVKLPNGVSEIGDLAFANCTNLNYVYIPNSVEFIGNDLFSGLSRVVVTSNSKGKAAEYAKKDDNCFFVSSWDKVKRCYALIEKEKGELIDRTFDIYGVEITCSSSYLVYREIKKHYEDLLSHKELYNALWDCFPTTVSGLQRAKSKYRKYSNEIKGYVNNALARLEKRGVLLPEGSASAGVVESVERLSDAYNKYIEYFLEIYQEGADDVYNTSYNLVTEAQNNATGLGYGIIGDASDLVLYNLDNLLTIRKQLKKNYAEAERLSLQYSEARQNQVEKAAEQLLKSIRSIFRELVDDFIKQLSDFEILELYVSNIIAINEEMDFKKSSHYCSLISPNKSGGYNVGLALRYDPANISVFEKAINNSIDNDGLYALAKFIGLKEKVSSIFIESIREKSNNTELCRLIKKIEKRKADLTEDDYLAIFHELAILYEENIVSSIQKDLDSAVDILEYCRKSLDRIYSQELVHSFLTHSIVPSELIGSTWDRDVVLDKLIEIRKTEVLKHRNYSEAENYLNNGTTLSDYKKAASLFKTLLEYRDGRDLYNKSKRKIEIESKYLKLVDKFNIADTQNEYITIKKGFDSLEGYRNSASYSKQCQSKINEFIEAQRELERVEKERKRKKKVRIAIIIGICIMVITLSVLIVFKIIIPSSKYNDAINLMKEGDYLAAKSVFDELDGFRDSNEKSQECDDEWYGSDYREATTYLENKQYEKALELFSSLDGYRDSDEKVLECQSRLSEIEDRKYLKQYNKAVSLMEKYEFDKALSIFKTTEGYKDSDTLAEECSTNIKYSCTRLMKEFEKYVGKLYPEEKINLKNDGDTSWDIYYDGDESRDWISAYVDKPIDENEGKHKKIVPKSVTLNPMCTIDTCGNEYNSKLIGAFISFFGNDEAAILEGAEDVVYAYNHDEYINNPDYDYRKIELSSGAKLSVEESRVADSGILGYPITIRIEYDFTMLEY